MPVIVAAVGGMLIQLVGSLIGRALIALGLSVVTYTGMSTSLGWMKQQVISAVGGAPAEVAQLLGYMKIGVALSIVTSAILARMVITGIQGDTFKKWVLK
mgnify:CR=1 FL=1